MKDIWKKTVYLIIGIGLIAIIAVYFFVEKKNGSNSDTSTPVVNQTQDQISEQSKPTFQDIDFAKKMVLINQQTMEIAGIGVQKSTNTSIKSIAAESYADALSDSKKYSSLLTEWSEPYLNLSDYPQQEGHDKFPTFPGMSKLSDVREVQNLPVSSFDQEYLKFVINHHEEVAEALSGSAGLGSESKHPNLVVLRSDYVKKLKDQINQMQQIQ